MKKYNITDFENSNFYQMPKWIFEGIFAKTDSDFKMAYMLLKDRAKLSKKNNWIDKNGDTFIIYPRKELQEKLNCGKEKMAKIMRELAEYNLIQEVRQGLGRPNLIYLLTPSCDDSKKDNAKNVENTLKSDKSSVKKDVKKSEEKNTNNSKKYEFKISNIKTRPAEVGFFNKISPKTDYTEVRLSDGNNNNINNNNINNNLSIYLNNINNINNRLIDRFNILKNIKSNIEYSIIKQKKNINIKMLDEITELMADVLISESESMKVNSEKVPTDVIKSRFLKINSEHIEYILESIENTTREIKNIRGYLITTIFNSYVTMDNYYSSKIKAYMSDFYVVY